MSCEYCLRSPHRCTCSDLSPTEEADARYLWERLLERGPGMVTVRDLHRSTQWRFARVRALRAALAELEKRGYVRPADSRREPRAYLVAPEAAEKGTRQDNAARVAELEAENERLRAALRAVYEFADPRRRDLRMDGTFRVDHKPNQRVRLDTDPWEVAGRLLWPDTPQGVAPTQDCASRQPSEPESDMVRALRASVEAAERKRGGVAQEEARDA